MEPKWGLGPIRAEDGSREAKKEQKTIFLTLFWSSFLRLWVTLFDAFLRCFFGRPLFRLFGDFWAPKVPKRLPKWSQNGAEREPEGTFWEV